MINQTIGERRDDRESGENGIRTNVYFKQVARTRNKEKGKEGLAG